MRVPYLLGAVWLGATLLSVDACTSTSVPDNELRPPVVIGIDSERGQAIAQGILERFGSRPDSIIIEGHEARLAMPPRSLGRSIESGGNHCHVNGPDLVTAFKAADYLQSQLAAVGVDSVIVGFPELWVERRSLSGRSRCSSPPVDIPFVSWPADSGSALPAA